MNLKNKIPIIIILCVALGFVAYTIVRLGLSDDKRENSLNVKTNSIIEGVVLGAEGKRIALKVAEIDNLKEISSATIDENGKFTLNTHIPKLNIYYLEIDNQPEKTIPLALIENDYIAINTTYNDFEINPKITGVEWSETMNNLLKILQENEEKTTKATKINELTRDFMLNNPESPFNLLLLSYFFVPTSDNIKIYESVVNAIENAYPSSDQASRFRMMLSSIRPEFPLRLINGDVFDIKKLRGKIVLIDFWASWCGPCRKSNPNLVTMYNKLKNKGFEIVSISLDEDFNKWQKAIIEDNLSWQNHISELRGWNSQITNFFGINSIPFTMVLDRNGIVIAKDLHGDNLQNFILKALDEK